MSQVEHPMGRDAMSRGSSQNRLIDGVLFRVVGVAAMALSVGCGGRARLEVAPVRGRVVYKGQGVPKATVIFIPAGEAAAEVGKIRPFAYADDQGNFQLKTYVDGDGAPPGEYRVSIVAFSSGGAVRTKDAPVGESAAPAPGVRIPPAVSKKFADVETAGIRVTVQEGENNLEPFDLGQTADMNRSAAAGSTVN